MDFIHTQTPSESLFRQVWPEREVLSRKDVVPFVASNKGGIPVTRLRAIITLRDRLPAFTLQTTVPVKTPHLKSGIGGLGGGLVPIQSRNGRRYVSLPSRGVRGNGGVLFLPRAGSSTIQLYTWNVEPLTLSRSSSNQSHAERQFLNWFEGHVRQYPQFARRVKQIRLFLNNSPCGWCTYDLCRFVSTFGLKNKVSITWTRAYTKGTDSAANSAKLQQCGIRVIGNSQPEISYEVVPQLRNLKVEKQQAHTYVLDKRVHTGKPQATNRRIERLLTGSESKLASLLSRVFASPHNRMRVKRLFERAIGQGNFQKRKGGGYEVVLPFKHTTGWSYGKRVHRLKAIIDEKGSWHYYPVP
ncbi:hypothetical protein MKJ04_15190 [Pontibacter sp. E15-1]|uniref:hypothetical protein n=1 Tax=Pontibacter sp. E15-1 TaxID=2919918 RepID=UPI001F4FA566|nr:hypothetical protein [Pontibacter sp. E15-1]MCJ8166191.1 hypothetical protein [Pontibacter sp. E15-1]